jgi:multidrug transporter EmrE-like cation transporter
MLYFLLAVLFTVALYLIMRSYPRFRVQSFHAIVFNYYACVATGLLLMEDWGQFGQVSWGSTGTLLTLALGTLFVVVFVVIGLTAQRVSVTAASLGGNMSLVIPVVFGLFIFQNANKEYTTWNYLGMVLALVALGLGAFQKKAASAAAEQPAPSAPTYLWVLPVLVFVGSGTNNTLINYLSMNYYRPDQTALFMIIACVGAMGIGTAILLVRLVVNKEKLLLRSVVGGLLLGVPNFLSLYFLLKALGAFGNSAAFVFPIYNILTMLVSSATAWLIFSERLNGLNRIGLALAVVAIVLISYQELGLQLE